MCSISISDMAAINPWLVDSIHEFWTLQCPECTFYSKEEEVFEDHAIESHSSSYVLFGKEVKQEQIDEFEDKKFNWKETDNPLDTVLSFADKEHTKNIMEL